MAVNAFTVLEITGIGVPAYSARGLQQTLTPIQQAAVLMRTVNGILDDLGDDSFKKYTSTISGSDQLAPPAVWPGLEVEVSCITELAFLTASGSAGRPIVTDSARVVDAFTYYRPKLTMRVVSINVSADEYGSQVNWSLQLEEI